VLGTRHENICVTRTGGLKYSAFLVPALQSDIDMIKLFENSQKRAQERRTVDEEDMPGSASGLLTQAGDASGS
jgi:hypothetical protein